MASLAQPPQGVSTGPHLDNRRIAAALIDLVIPVALGAAAYAAGLSLTRGVVLVALAWTLYYFFALESGDGQTLGKRVMKLRVVSADGSPATMAQIAKRTVVRILDGHIVGLIVMLATGERRQRLGDILAGTVVTEAATASEAAPPPETAVAEPARRLAPVPSDEPGPGTEAVPWHKRSLKMPTLSRPSRAKALTTAQPPAARRKRSLSVLSLRVPSLPVPSLRRRPTPEDEVSSQTGAAGPSTLSAAVMSARRSGEPVAELEPFDPFNEPRHPPVADEHESDVVVEREPEPEFDLDHEPEVEMEADPAPLIPAPAPIHDAQPTPEPMDIEAFMQRDVVIERDEPASFDDEPSVGPEEGPVVELDEPTPDLHPEPAAEPEPYVEPEEIPAAAEAEEPEETPMTIKPIETVSAIDLVMQDAQDRHPGTR